MTQLLSNEMDFSKYDSSRFPTLFESIVDAKDNPLLINNLSDQIAIAFGYTEYLVQEPTSAFKDLLFYFDNYLEDIEIPEEEFYRPELTAIRKYRCADLWYTIMLVNSFMTVNEYNKKNIKVIRNDKMSSIGRFISMSKNKIRLTNENDNLDNFDF